MATDFSSELGTPLLIVGGIALAFAVGNWIYAKVRSARA